MMAMRGGWILEVDIRKFFDILDHGHLRAILKRRIRDGVLLRLIGKWLKAGVLEDGMRHAPGDRQPAGWCGFTPPRRTSTSTRCWTTWFEQTVKPRLKGRASLIRYADDAVLGLRAGRRRPTGPGRAAQAVWQVRPDAPSGEDPAGAVPGATAGSPTGLP